MEIELIKRVGIIGLGHQANSYFVPALEISSNIRLVSICDTQTLALDSFPSQFNVSKYRDFNKMLEIENLDFIIVAVPHDIHLPVIRAAAKNNVHVLKEKPFARTLLEAQEIYETLENSNIKVATAIQRRFYPSYKDFFHQREKLGEIIEVNMDYELMIENPELGWRGNMKRAGGGCIIDMGYHMIDLLVWYFGCPSNVRAKFDETHHPEREAMIEFSFGKNLFGTIHLSRKSKRKLERVLVKAEKGIAEVTKNTIRITYEDGRPPSTKTYSLNKKVIAKMQINNFLQLIDHGTNKISSLEHMNHLRVIESCYMSNNLNQTVQPRFLDKLDVVVNAANI